MGYFDLKKQIQSGAKPKTGGYFELKESLADIIEANRAREEYDRQQKERTEKLAEVRANYERNLAEAQKAISPWNIAKETVKETGRNILGFGKEVGKAALRSGAMVGDIASRLSPIEGIKNIAGGIKTAIQRPRGETIPQAYERGVLKSKARPLMYERLESKFQDKDYRLPKLETKSGLPTGLITQPEYRKPLTAAMEAPTYLFGGKPIKEAGRGLLARMLSRTAATQPEAIIEAGLATAGEEKPTLKSAAMNYLAATLLMSGISNIAGEIRIKRDSPKVQNTKKELENIYGEELPDEAADDLAEAFSQGVEKKTILENAKKAVEETPKEEVLTPRKLKAGEFAPIAKEIQETTGKKLTATEQLKIKDDIERGISKEKIIKDILEPPKRTELTSKAVKEEKRVKTPAKKEEPKTDDLISQARKMSKEEFVSNVKKIFKKVEDEVISISEKNKKSSNIFVRRDLTQKGAEIEAQKRGAGFFVVKDELNKGRYSVARKGEISSRITENEAEEIANKYSILKKAGILKLNKGDKDFPLTLDYSGRDNKIADIWNKAQATKGKKPKAKPKTPEEAPKPVAKKHPKKSITSQKLNEIMPDEYKINEDYDAITLKSELDRASKEISKNKDEALRKAFSREERVDRRIAKLEEFSQIAQRDKDYEAVNRLFTQANKVGTETAQGLNMMKALYAVNPQYKYMQDVINARLGKIKVGVKDVKNATKEARKMVAKRSKELKDKTKEAFKIKDAQELLNKIMCK